MTEQVLMRTIRYEADDEEYIVELLKDDRELFLRVTNSRTKRYAERTIDLYVDIVDLVRVVRDDDAIYDYEEAVTFLDSVVKELDRRREGAAQTEADYWSYLDEEDEEDDY